MEIKARIPGKIVAVNVQEGDVVEVRQALCILEAMKMEQPIPSPVAGIVSQVNVAIDDKVKSGQVLFVIKEKS